MIRKTLFTVFALALALQHAVTAIGSEVAQLPVADGKFVSYHTSHDLMQRHEQIRRAVIMIHGTLRNPETYFDRTLTSAQLSGAEADTLLLAPGFHTEDEVAEDECHWSSSGWKQGDLALNAREETKVSSFDVVDGLMELAVNRANFPALDQVTIVGHSAGGQFVNRYIAYADLAQCENVDVTFVVMNPSSYLYLDRRRPTTEGFRDAEELSEEFPGYNRYRYGIEDLNTAMRSISRNQIAQNMTTRRCCYFGGSEDTQDEYLDMSPGAMAQGRHRYARFAGYQQYVASYEDERWRQNSTFVAVPEVGHSSSDMLATDEVREVLFGDRTITADK